MQQRQQRIQEHLHATIARTESIDGVVLGRLNAPLKEVLAEAIALVTGNGSASLGRAGWRCRRVLDGSNRTGSRDLHLATMGSSISSDLANYKCLSGTLPGMTPRWLA